MASGALMRLARPRARPTPPTSGETTITLPISKRSLMSRTIIGAAYKLSVGMSKKPWICPACRSSVITRSAPARVIRLDTSLAEIGDDRGDAPPRRAAQRVDDDEQFHQVVVGRIRRRLDDEHVGAAHVFLNLDEDFHVGEAPHHRLGQRGREVGGDGVGKRRIGVAGDNLDRSVIGPHPVSWREVPLPRALITRRRQGWQYDAPREAGFVPADSRHFPPNRSYPTSAMALMWRP